MSGGPRRVNASRLFLLATIVGLLGCVAQLAVSLDLLPPALDPVSTGCGACALVVAIAGWIFEGRWRVRTAEALGVAIAALLIGPVVAHLHTSAVVVVVVLSLGALVHDLDVGE
ncbi:MAG: hypothetical protein IPL61_08805 [Myxococcales bacterium]|nr:hypothetical protein [Myxococcales bacterium]